MVRDGMNHLFINLGVRDPVKGVGLDVAAFQQPRKERPQPAVLGFDVGLGDGQGMLGVPFTKPAGPGLKGDEVGLYVVRGDLVALRPVVCLTEPGKERQGPLQCFQVRWGVPVACPKADYEPFTGFTN